MRLIIFQIDILIFSIRLLDMKLDLANARI
jgi:hypothetical protein